MTLTKLNPGHTAAFPTRTELPKVPTAPFAPLGRQRRRNHGISAMAELMTYSLVIANIKHEPPVQYA
jgi:hypothetical protein